MPNFAPKGSQDVTKICLTPNKLWASHIMLKAIKNILRNRVEILEFNRPQDQKECTLLSEVSLFNQYVPELKRDVVFNKNNFNPLKYNFSFYARGASMYKVDNTNYYILIKPQHQQ